MFEKKRVLGAVVFVLLAIAFIGMIGVVSAGYSINAINKGITFPVDGEVYTYPLDYFNWTLFSTSHPLENCYYNINSGADIYFNCSNMSVSFSTLIEGAYNLVLDVNNSFDANHETIFFYVDTIEPGVSFVAPTEADGANRSQSYVAANVSVIEGNPRNITYILYNSSGLVDVQVFSMADQFSNTTLNWSGLADGTYYYNVSVVDVAGRFNSTETRTISLDTINPLIEYTSAVAVDGANLSQSFIFVEINATEMNEESISFNLYNETNGLINSTGVAGQREVTWAVPDGSYYYNVSIVDYAGNTNQTETRLINLDSTAPNITLTDYPQNNRPFEFWDNNKSVAFNVTDMSVIVNCSFVSDLKNMLNDSVTSIENNFSLEDLASGRYSWQIVCIDSFGNIGTSENKSFTILANLTFPEGTNSTNLSAEGDISNVSSYFVQNEFGMINWSVSLDLSRGLDWAEYINISLNRVDVNSSGAPELNAPAVITLNNITWTSPRILKNGVECADCSVISYENGTLVFTVTGFSVYTTDETPGGVSASGSGGGGGSCTTTWACTEWSSCAGGIQTRICSKKKSWCAAYEAKPAENQSCIVASTPAVINNFVAEEQPEAPVESSSGSTSEEERKGFFGTITGAVIGGGAFSYLFVIALLAIAVAYVIVYLKRQQTRAISKRILIRPYDLREQ